ncbi:MAG: lytic transglycosylase domain-containing protein [Proteobacteria bacterium]|nr:lytic transglycosylase domain-containing protein [Pseudomonadota bacterium]
MTLFASGLSYFPRTLTQEVPAEIAVISPPEDEVIQGEPQVTIQDLPQVKPMRLFAVSSKYDQIIFSTARELDVDPALVKAIVQSESAFDKFAVSTQGARGLMQLMPATAERFFVHDPFDAEQNIRGGVRFLKHLLVIFDNDERLAVAAYNAGPGRVRYYGNVPPFLETYTYVSKVLGLRKLYSEFKDESGKSFAMLEAAISI